jgi:hypothetical protein
MVPVYALWPGTELPDDTQEIYYRLCAHLPDAVFVEAVLDVVSTHTYGFPKPGDILDAAVGVVMERQGLSEGWARQALDDLKREHHKLLAEPPAAGSRAGQMAALTAGIGRTKGERG